MAQIDPLFADIPAGPVSEIVVTDADTRDWQIWQDVNEAFRYCSPKGSLMDLARDGLMVFRTGGGV